jgi:hypothetical protein
MAEREIVTLGIRSEIFNNRDYNNILQFTSNTAPSIFHGRNALDHLVTPSKLGHDPIDWLANGGVT